MPTPRNAEEIAALLLARDPLPPLLPTQVFDLALTEEIAALPSSSAVKTGLFLLNDDLASGHTLAQSLQGQPLGDFWHAIIHRREGDWNNARYWFGKAGPEAILVQIYGADPKAPDTFINRCRKAGPEPEAELEQFQREEMVQLLEYSLSRPD